MTKKYRVFINDTHVIELPAGIDELKIEVFEVSKKEKEKEDVMTTTVKLKRKKK